MRAGEGNRKNSPGVSLTRIAILNQPEASGNGGVAFSLKEFQKCTSCDWPCPKRRGKKRTLIGLNKESSLTGLEGNFLEVRKMWRVVCVYQGFGNFCNRVYSQPRPWSQGTGHKVSRSAVPTVPAALSTPSTWPCVVKTGFTHFAKAVSGWQGSAFVRLHARSSCGCTVATC